MKLCYACSCAIGDTWIGRPIFMGRCERCMSVGAIALLSEEELVKLEESTRKKKEQEFANAA